MWVVGHAQVGWFSAWLSGLKRRDRVLVAAAGAFPDLDGLSILFGIEAYFTAHHVWLHNVWTAMGLGVAAFVLADRRVVTGLLATAAVLLHVASDGLGLLALAPLWPVSRRVFWPSQGSLLVAFLGEVCVPALLLWWAWRVERSRGVGILEVLPPRWESAARAWWIERKRRSREPVRSQDEESPR